MVVILEITKSINTVTMCHSLPTLNGIGGVFEDGRLLMAEKAMWKTFITFPTCNHFSKAKLLSA